MKCEKLFGDIAETLKPATDSLDEFLRGDSDLTGREINDILENALEKVDTLLGEYKGNI